MKIPNTKLLKPLLLAVSFVVFAIVKINRSGDNKKSEKNLKKGVDKRSSL
ncbi:MAG: hypothetical protein J6W65_02585 [Oscillospiraceae bacterium]|nr:hypothetical protein [Oscillospiraceae bacterium]